MTREIKFRAWDNQHKQMNYKVCVGNTDMKDENYTCSTILIDGEWVHFDDYCDIVVEQYTGVKDTNGVEIYEGDVIREKTDRDEYLLAEVIYKDGCFMGKEFMHEPEYPIFDFIRGEVIGNIHENGDLLQ